jgi:hypothetical protein
MSCPSQACVEVSSKFELLKFVVTVIDQLVVVNSTHCSISHSLLQLLLVKNKKESFSTSARIKCHRRLHSITSHSRKDPTTYSDLNGQQTIIQQTSQPSFTLWLLKTSNETTTPAVTLSYTIHIVVIIISERSAVVVNIVFQVILVIVIIDASCFCHNVTNTINRCRRWYTWE